MQQQFWLEQPLDFDALADESVPVFEYHPLAPQHTNASQNNPNGLTERSQSIPAHQQSEEAEVDNFPNPDTPYSDISGYPQTPYSEQIPFEELNLPVLQDEFQREKTDNDEYNDFNYNPSSVSSFTNDGHEFVNEFSNGLHRIESVASTSLSEESTFQDFSMGPSQNRLSLDSQGLSSESFARSRLDLTDLENLDAEHDYEASCFYGSKSCSSLNQTQAYNHMQQLNGMPENFLLQNDALSSELPPHNTQSARANLNDVSSESLVRHVEILIQMLRRKRKAEQEWEQNINAPTTSGEGKKKRDRSSGPRDVSPNPSKRNKSSAVKTTSPSATATVTRESQASMYQDPSAESQTMMWSQMNYTDPPLGEIIATHSQSQITSVDPLLPQPDVPSTSSARLPEFQVTAPSTSGRTRHQSLPAPGPLRFYSFLEQLNPSLVLLDDSLFCTATANIPMDANGNFMRPSLGQNHHLEETDSTEEHPRESTSIQDFDTPRIDDFHIAPTSNTNLDIENISYLQDLFACPSTAAEEITASSIIPSGQSTPSVCRVVPDSAISLPTLDTSSSSHVLPTRPEGSLSSAWNNASQEPNSSVSLSLMPHNGDADHFISELFEYDWNTDCGANDIPFKLENGENSTPYNIFPSQPSTSGENQRSHSHLVPQIEERRAQVFQEQKLKQRPLQQQQLNQQQHQPQQQPLEQHQQPRQQQQYAEFPDHQEQHNQQQQYQQTTEGSMCRSFCAQLGQFKGQDDALPLNMGTSQDLNVTSTTAPSQIIQSPATGSSCTSNNIHTNSNSTTTTTISNKNSNDETYPCPEPSTSSDTSSSNSGMESQTRVEVKQEPSCSSSSAPKKDNSRKEKGSKRRSSAPIEPGLLQAAMESVQTGSMTPMVKKELKWTILSRRHLQGKEELKVTFSPPRPTELTEEEKRKRQHKKDLNRVAAANFRDRKKAKKQDLEQECEDLRHKNQELEDQLREGNAEKQMWLERLASFGFSHTILEDILNSTV